MVRFRSGANFWFFAVRVQSDKILTMGIGDGLSENMSTAQDTYDYEKEIMKEFLSEPLVDQKRPIEGTLPELTKDPIFNKKIMVGGSEQALSKFCFQFKC